MSLIDIWVKNLRNYELLLGNYIVFIKNKSIVLTSKLKQNYIERIKSIYISFQKISSYIIKSPYEYYSQFVDCIMNIKEQIQMLTDLLNYDFDLNMDILPFQKLET